VTKVSNCLWKHLWGVKNLSRSKWARWLVQLAVFGLEPKVAFTIGAEYPLRWPEAVMIARAYARVERPRLSPPWVCGIKRQPIGRQHRCGAISRWPTIVRAKRGAKDAPTHLAKMAHLAMRDAHGHQWFED
jgi:hypothetical protein